MKQRFAVVLLFCLALVRVAVADEEKVLNVYNWADYIGPDTLRDFTVSTGIKVNYDTYESNEALLAKMQGGASGYDVAVPSDYMVAVMRRAGLLTPLDHGRLPNLVNIDPKFKNLAHDPGNRYSIPYLWGTTGIGIRIDKVKIPIDSFMALLKPAPQLAGRISMLNDMREVMGMALKALGHSINTTDPGQIEAAKKLLLAQKDKVKSYDSHNYKNLLASGEVWVSHAWSGDISSLYWKGNRNVRFVMPKEGGLIWMDNVVIPKGARHPENAHRFLDFLMNPRTAADIANSTYCASPNKAARPFITKALLEDKTIYPAESVLKKYEFLTDPGKAIKRYDEAWTELKAW